MITNIVVIMQQDKIMSTKQIKSVTSRSKGSHKSLNVEPVVRLGSNLFGCIGGLKVSPKIHMITHQY